METYSEDLLNKMREIYKCILERVVDTGEFLESDVLFMKLYKEKFEIQAVKLVKGD